MLQSRTRLTTTAAAAAAVGEIEGFIYDDAYHCNGISLAPWLAILIIQ